MSAFIQDLLSLDPEEEEPPPPLLGGIPLAIAGDQVVSGRFREDQIAEVEVDRETGEIRVLRLASVVITSYSIHYTKLYELTIITRMVW